MSDIKIVAFIKAVEHQYFDDFINKGQVCLNTIKWFREYEKNDANIGDSYEGVNIACAGGMTISFADPIESYSSEADLKLKIDNANWSKPFPNVENFKGFDKNDDANIFSLYVITSTDNDSQKEEHTIPYRFVSEFSNHRFVMIINPSLFLTKMEDKFRSLGRSMKTGLVEYYKLDNEPKDNLSFFNKQHRYSYQKEFRIVSEDSRAEQLILNIGSLNNIAIEIFPNDNIYKLINEDIELLVRME